MRNALNATLFVVSLLSSPASVALAQGQPADDRLRLGYVEDAHSSIRFAVEYVGILKVEGHFDEYQGYFLYDKTDITNSVLYFFVLTTSANTHHARRDRDIRSQRLLNAVDFPAATFESTRIEKQDEGYVAVGPLTIRGISKEVEVPFTVTGETQWSSNSDEESLFGVEARFTIDRREFGMTWQDVGGTLNGALFVGNEVEIHARLLFEGVDVTDEGGAREEIIAPRSTTHEALRRFTGTYVDSAADEQIEVLLINGRLISRIGRRLIRNVTTPGRPYICALLPVDPIEFKAQCISGDQRYVRFIVHDGHSKEVLLKNEESALDSSRWKRENVKLTWVLSFEGFSQTIRRQGIDAAVKEYHTFKQNNPSLFSPFDEREMNTLGSRFLRTEKIKEAVAVFKINVEEYPESWSAYDSLAEAYMEHGDHAMAIENYQKALRLNPDNENIKAALDELKGN